MSLHVGQQNVAIIFKLFTSPYLEQCSVCGTSCNYLPISNQVSFFVILYNKMRHFCVCLNVNYSLVTFF